MTGHIGADALAEYQAGLISGRRGRQIAAHVQTCGDCGLRANRLSDVSALLAAAPPPALPDALAARLDAALAAEAAARPLPAERSGEASPTSAERPAGTGPGSDHGADRGGAGRRTRAQQPRGPRGSRVPWLWSPRVLAPVAVVAVLAAGIYGLTRIPAASSSSSAASSAAGAARLPIPSAAGPANSSILQAPAAAAPAGTPSPRGGKASVSSPGQIGVVPSTIKYQQSTLLRQVAAQLRELDTLLPNATPLSSQLVACVTRVTGGAQPILVESATYNGGPATIIVTRGGAAYHVWAVGPACSGTQGDIEATAVLPTGI